MLFPTRAQLRALPVRQRFLLMEAVWESVFHPVPELAFGFRRMVLTELLRWDAETSAEGDGE